MALFLILCTVQIVAAAGIYRMSQGMNKLGALVLAAAGVGLGALCPILPALLLESLVLCAVGVACHFGHVGVGKFAAAAVAASALLIGGMGADEVQRGQRLKQQYPLEDLSARIAYESRLPAPLAEVAVSESVESQVESLENAIYWDEVESRWRRRSLEKIHASKVEQFVAAEGFGVSRMTPSMRLASVKERPPVPMCAESGTDAETAVVLPRSYGPPARDLLDTLHFQSVSDFVNARGFGYVRSRSEVAGFQAHAFSQMPRFNYSPWHVHTVELVSLLKHDPPAVYVSDNLPRMEELRDAPTRELKSFELAALDKLRSGEGLVVEPDPGVMLRMVGAIRAGRQCLDCHQGPRGALLGAFTYRLK